MNWPGSPSAGRAIRQTSAVVPSPRSVDDTRTASPLRQVSKSLETSTA